MGTIPNKIETWQMVQPWTKEGEKVIPGKIERKTIDMPPLNPGEVLVEIAGCGVCHTDLGYFYDFVPTLQKPPLTLGHEISGRVIAGKENMIGKEVIIPAVMPCNNCPICAAGRNNRCLNQKMPGNSLGIYGGFSSHIVVPADDLCAVSNRGSMPLEHLAVVADAISTPYQAAVRADLQKGDLCLVIGTGGGIGCYMTQMCKAFGARAVVGIDIVEEKLQRALKFGATQVINSKGKSVKDVREDFRTLCKTHQYPSNYGWKIFECTGTRAGQEIGLELLSFIGKLIVVGYGTAKTEYMVSRLMAFDAEMIGTWSCLPKYYPKALEMVLNKTIEMESFVEVKPMSMINKVFEEIHRAGSPDKRIVLVPDF
jgi:6-hydroxycyclohex-1-ene-1-carbonyl-CoA dehydrogenase